MNVHAFNPKRLEGKEWRIPDTELAAALGYSSTGEGRQALRKIIRSHAKILKEFSILASKAIIQDGPGRPGTAYWLTKEQAMFVASKSEQPNATAATVALIKSFQAYEAGDFDTARQYGEMAATLLGFKPREWEREFSPEFADQLHRVGGWGRGKGKWNSQCAHFINQYIYGHLWGELGLKILQEANPMGEEGRAQRHHQMLKTEHLPRLRSHIDEVHRMLKNCISLKMFDTMFNRAFEKKHTTIGFIFPEEAA